LTPCGSQTPRPRITRYRCPTPKVSDTLRESDTMPRIARYRCPTPKVSDTLRESDTTPQDYALPVSDSEGVRHPAGVRHHVQDYALPVSDSEGVRHPAGVRHHAPGLRATGV